MSRTLVSPKRLSRVARRHLSEHHSCERVKWNCPFSQAVQAVCGEQDDEIERKDHDGQQAENDVYAGPFGTRPPTVIDSASSPASRAAHGKLKARAAVLALAPHNKESSRRSCSRATCTGKMSEATNRSQWNIMMNTATVANASNFHPPNLHLRQPPLQNDVNRVWVGEGLLAGEAG